MSEKVFANGTVKPCCLDAANLDPLPEESRGDLTVKKCRVCGCRHRRLTLDPMKMGMRMKPLGAA